MVKDDVGQLSKQSDILFSLDYDVKIWDCFNTKMDNNVISQLHIDVLQTMRLLNSKSNPTLNDMILRSIRDIFEFKQKS